MDTEESRTLEMLEREIEEIARKLTGAAGSAQAGGRAGLADELRACSDRLLRAASELAELRQPGVLRAGPGAEHPFG